MQLKFILEPNRQLVYYEWNNTPVLYDEYCCQYYRYCDGKWFAISRNTALDMADEIMDKSRIQKLFTAEIIQQYVDYQNGFTYKATIDRQKN